MAKQRPIDKCKLCALTKKLCDSHYLPKRLYGFLRATQMQNPNPLMEVGGELKQVSVQYRGYVFCEDCEDLFNKHGEKWVLANIPHDYDAMFPLHDAINQLKPVFSRKGLVLCDVNVASAFDLDKLVYFAMSIFWRGAVHEWRTKTVAPRVNLGALEHPIRKFLLSEGPLPGDENMVLTIDVALHKGPSSCVPSLRGPLAGMPSILVLRARFVLLRFLGQKHSGRFAFPQCREGDHRSGHGGRRFCNRVHETRSKE